MHRIILLALLLQTVSASIWHKLGLSSIKQHRNSPRFVKRQSGGGADCRLNYTTDIWTSCASLIEQFNLTLDYFEYVNPSIGINCTNFVPGSTYCVETGQFVAQFQYLS